MRKKIALILLAIIILSNLTNASALKDADNITRAEAVEEIIKTLYIAEGYTNFSFGDHYCYHPGEGGYVHFVPDETLSPNGYPLLCELYASAYGIDFSDVSDENGKLSSFIIIAGAMGIIRGYGDNTFCPDKLITYNEAVTMLVRAFSFEESDGCAYPEGYIKMASEIGIAYNSAINGNEAIKNSDFFNFLTMAKTNGYSRNSIVSANQIVEYTSYNDEFQAFLEKWKLTGLFPECRTMTAENQERFVKYFQQLDDVTHNYIILLLQGVADGTIRLVDSGYKYGVYLNSCSLCLYDMNQDGFPELILKTGSCEADYMYTVYSAVDGELVNCGELSGSHCVLYTNGSGSFVRYERHMGIYSIDISSLEGTTLKTQIIEAEVDNKYEQYPELDKYGYGDYNQFLTFSDVPAHLIAPGG